MKSSEKFILWIFWGFVSGVIVSAEVAVRSRYSSTGMVAGLLVGALVIGVGALVTDPDAPRG